MNLQEYQDFLSGYTSGYKLDKSSEEDVLKLGLMGECGEVIEVIKKGLMGGVLDSTALRAELGDVLAYHALILKGLGLSLIHI
jgi:NTP pyrophosphatase (non-canonical NTP hydrolase)